MPPKAAPAAAAAAADAAPAAATSGERPSVKKDFIVAIEKQVQQQWAKTKPFNAEIDKNKPKYMITFPYPYMNGRLHLGHGFSFSKCEFAARFQRMKGKNVLWGFGLHVTGTPIAACAQKLRNEMAKYGNPPQFPRPLTEEEQEEAAKKKAEEQKSEAASKDLSKHKGKRGKVAVGKFQWQIMQGMGIPDAEIPSFADPMKWLNFFPPLALRDTRHMGCHIDYRRSFITTDVNPYYDSFIRWQFEILHSKGYLGFGERYCIYTTVDKQPCADHDRASGEGVPPQEYIVVKLEVKNAKQLPAFAEFADKIGDKRVILPGATLRAETVVGQTNCWVSPNVTYKAYEVIPILSPSELRRRGKNPEAIVPVEGAKPEIFMTTSRCAHNLAYQNYSVSGITRGEPEPLFEVEGDQLIGTPVAAPYAPFETIYALPMATISDTKGTAIVMSVPSDSPDDWINFTTLAKKPDYRAKLNLKDEWVLPFNIVPIIDIPGELGENAAEVACAKFKVSGAKDADPLALAKELCYSEGFYKGTMKIGPFKGEKVMDAKKLMATKMIGEGTAIVYQEPQKQVINRSGDECVVALCDQWFLTYSNEHWKAPVREYIKNKLDTYTFPGVKNGLVETADWLSEWPCSRNFGLGTQMPGAKPEDGKVIIDSLSDSTIYMAYYTVAKYLHASDEGDQLDEEISTEATSDSLNLNGHRKNRFGITPAMMTSAAWDFVLLNKGTAESVHAATGLPIEMANKMRDEFNYFYPCDLRTSGKDLIQNHLTMALFNHAAVWESDPSKWIQSIYCNGHILVDNEKMSKAAGNFILLGDALDEYTADGTRLAFAEAGDSMNDANFVRASAGDHILRLHALITAFKERQAKLSEYRGGAKTLFDKMFENIINTTIQKADYYYDRMLFQKAMNLVYFEWTAEIIQYELMCGGDGPHKDVIARLHDVLPRLLMPLCPHTCEYLWTEVLGHADSSINDVAFPTVSEAGVDAAYSFATKLIFDVAGEIRAGIQRMQKKKVTPSTVYVFTREQYLPWQVAGLGLLQEILKANEGEFPKDTTKMITSRKDLDWLEPSKMPEIMGFLSFQRTASEKYGPKALEQIPPIQDADVLAAANEFLTRQTGIKNIVIVKADAAVPKADLEKVREKSRPMQPALHFDE